METRWPQLLATYLDALEDLIHKELSDPRTARGQRGKPISGVYGANLRELDLMQALEGIAAAREELACHPDGARLAMLVSAVELNRLRLPAESETRRYQGGEKGAGARKLKRTQDAARLRSKFRRAAAKLKKQKPHLSTASSVTIAKALARKFPRSERTIRRAIAKRKTARPPRRT